MPQRRGNPSQALFPERMVLPLRDTQPHESSGRCRHVSRGWAGTFRGSQEYMTRSQVDRVRPKLDVDVSSTVTVSTMRYLLNLYRLASAGAGTSRWRRTSGRSATPHYYYFVTNLGGSGSL